MGDFDVEAFWKGTHADGRGRYSDLKMVGQGAYSVVVRANDAVSKERVAIKKIAEVFYDAHEAKKVLREVRLLRDFHHPHIISLRDLVTVTSMETFQDIWMVTDFMDGDLRKRIKSKQEMPVETVRSYMAQLLSALAHVHAIHGIHRDLKPANILLNANGLLKLCDFGLARTVTSGARYGDRERRAGSEVESSVQQELGGDPDAGGVPKPPPLKPQMTSYVVTRWYRAPEVILQEPYSAAIDVWAAGCIFKELLELMPGSKFRTGAIFPGRYCLPFSFDEHHSTRQRNDQLAVICRVLAAPTPEEFRWASKEGQAEVRGVCGEFSSLTVAERAAERSAKLQAAVPIATGEQLGLLEAMLDLNPNTRPSAAAALGAPYFDALPSKPPVTIMKDREEVDAAFKFENANLDINDLRVLLANDLFRVSSEQEAESKMASASLSGEAAP